MKTRHAVLVPCVMALAMASGPAPSRSRRRRTASGRWIRPGAIKAEGTWSLGARAGDFVFLAGVQGYELGINSFVARSSRTRIRRAFANIKKLAELQGATLHDCVRVTVYLSDLPSLSGRHRR